MQYLYIIIAALLGCGAWLICCALVFRDRSFTGRKRLHEYARWQGRQQDFWDSPVIQKMTGFAGRFVFPDENTVETLTRQLTRAGLELTPKEFLARRYVILFFGVLGAGFCALLRFWLGIGLCALLTIYLMMRQRETLQSRLKKHDDEIAAEMPRFVQTICRTLQSNRDIYAALSSYRKVAGETLGAELDILMTHMRSGNIQTALQQFRNRIGTDDAFRLCSALTEIDRGIDQFASLQYLAEDMMRRSDLELRKQFSLRPGKMRRTYLPAVGICIAMILYVMVVFVIDQLNNLI